MKPRDRPGYSVMFLIGIIVLAGIAGLALASTSGRRSGFSRLAAGIAGLPSATVSAATVPNGNDVRPFRFDAPDGALKDMCRRVSARLYWQSKLAFFAPKHIAIPTAISVFPDEIHAAPRSWAERAYPRLIHFKELPKGGHFAAWEQPAVFAAELRDSFKSLRDAQ